MEARMTITSSRQHDGIEKDHLDTFRNIVYGTTEAYPYRVREMRRP